WRRYFEKRLAEKLAAAIAATIGQRSTTGRSSTTGGGAGGSADRPLLEEGEGLRPRAPVPAPHDSRYLKGAHMHTQHDKPASFHRSPQEAMQAPREEFLYLGCLHEGTGVDAPDFIAVVDAEEGRILHETPMPNVGDELHHYGWNRCSSACHGPDRSHLIVPGFRSL